MEDLCWKDFYTLAPIRQFCQLQEDDLLNITKEEFKCADCDQDALVYDEKMDETMCIECGLVQCFNTCRVTHRLRDTSYRISPSIYKHIDYLERKLDELECKRIIVKEMIFTIVMRDLQDKTISIKNIQKILRHHGYEQCFLQIPTILNMIDANKYPPLVLNGKQRRMIIGLFKCYLTTFHQLNRDGQFKRKNLLNYHFVLYKIFKLANVEIRDHYFLLPTGKKTIDIHEKIWRQIVLKNKWTI